MGYLTELDDSPSYWLGFDCAHAGDFVPGMEMARTIMETMISKVSFLDWPYRTLHYVMNETKKLAEQLREVEQKK